MYKKLKKKLCGEQIDYLFSVAEKYTTIDKKISDRCIEMAKKLSMKYNVRISKESKLRFCKYCLKYFTGDNLRTRTNHGILYIYCKNCNKYRKIVIK